jgi:hypothetical protein
MRCSAVVERVLRAPPITPSRHYGRRKSKPSLLERQMLNFICSKPKPKPRSPSTRRSSFYNAKADTFPRTVSVDAAMNMSMSAFDNGIYTEGDES